MFDGSNESLYHADEENHLHFLCHNCAITNSYLCDVTGSQVESSGETYKAHHKKARQFQIWSAVPSLAEAELSFLRCHQEQGVLVAVQENPLDYGGAAKLKWNLIFAN